MRTLLPLRLHSIQGMRFVASFAVMVHHSLTAFGGPLTGVSVGAAGVDVFFVISGVVIGYADHSDGVRAFVLKRFIRIFPLYWIATLVYGLFRARVLGWPPTLSHWLHSAVLVPDFFSPLWMPIYYPAWSLYYELSFYTLFAVLLALAGAGATVAAALCAAGLAAMTIPVPFVPGAVFGTESCLEFAGGLLLAEALSRGWRPSRRFGALAMSLGIAAFLFRLPAQNLERALGWGVPSFLLVAGALGLESWPGWRARPVALAGDASYALYLFHIPAMEGVYEGLRHWGVPVAGRLRFVALREVLMLGLALALGLVVHVAVERPMLRVLRRLVLGRGRARAAVGAGA